VIEHSQFLTLLFHFSFTQVALRYCGSKFVPYNTSFFLHFLTEEGHCLLFVVCFGFIIIGEATHTNESVLSPSHTMMLNSLHYCVSILSLSQRCYMNMAISYHLSYSSFKRDNMIFLSYTSVSTTTSSYSLHLIRRTQPYTLTWLETPEFATFALDIFITPDLTPTAIFSMARRYF